MLQQMWYMCVANLVITFSFRPSVIVPGQRNILTDYTPALV